jgi:hypothetical protein
MIDFLFFTVLKHVSNILIHFYQHIIISIKIVCLRFRPPIFFLFFLLIKPTIFDIRLDD